MNCIKKWDLTQYDTFESVGAGNPYREPASNIKEGMCGNCIKWIQHQLNLFGYNLKVDGIFGYKTNEAVREFQKDHNLVVDGIVGVKTRTALKAR
jgi:peptidoglycan hydrolase-like protein with peptidoglycan-binding domain